MATTVDISSSLEDYLEAIAEIIEQKGHAHTKDIADRLKVKMPSVTNALQALSARGLINYQSHTPVELTTVGAETAAVIRHRHKVLKEFFSQVLELDAECSDSTACRIEHVIGETVLSRIVALAEAIAGREDCAALREYLETTMPKICPEPGEELLSLDQPARHQKVRRPGAGSRHTSSDGRARTVRRPAPGQGDGQQSLHARRGCDAYLGQALLNGSFFLRISFSFI